MPTCEYDPRRWDVGLRGYVVVLLSLACLALNACGNEPSRSASEWSPAENQPVGTAADADGTGTSAQSPTEWTGGPVDDPAMNGAEAQVDAATSPVDGAGASTNDPAGMEPSSPDTGDAAVNASDAATGFTPVLPPVESTDRDGPFATTQDLRAGPAGDSGVFRPADLGQGGVQHPIFVWGCGGGSTPSSYADLMSRVASHGFVVIAETSSIGDDGAPLVAAMDWLFAEHGRTESVFYQKLDTSRIAVGGHSIGSVNAFHVAPDPRFTTSIHVAGGSLDMPRNISAPTTGSGGKGLVHPVAYLCSERDTFGNVEKMELDYENTTAPAWLTVMSGVDHTAAAREGLPAIIAWLRWQLAGEVERRAAFLDTMGDFNRGDYVSKNKNW